jgi:hypothetical protein
MPCGNAELGYDRRCDSGLWTLVGAIGIVVERRRRELVLSLEAQPKLKRDVAVPRDHVDYILSKFDLYDSSTVGDLVYLVLYIRILAAYQLSNGRAVPSWTVFRVYRLPPPCYQWSLFWTVMDRLLRRKPDPGQRGDKSRDQN